VTIPFYVPPEQMIKDKADYARKNIAKGRDLIACSATEGIVIVTENQFRTLYKISEVYDRIAFGGVGKYNEFENLRVLGVRQADLKGYQFAREDVNARALANAYGQTLGQVFTQELKPYEVEILLAEVGATQDEDKLYHITYDGTVMDEQGCSVLGGRAETISEALSERYHSDMSGAEAIKLCVELLAGTDRELGPDQLEVAILDRSRPRRAFVRMEGTQLAEILAA
jgi:proteasome alpha subunit